MFPVETFVQKGEYMISDNLVLPLTSRQIKHTLKHLQTPTIFNGLFTLSLLHLHHVQFLKQIH